jgi:uncharacterized protein
VSEGALEQPPGRTLEHPRATVCGLVISLVSAPGFVAAYRALGGEDQSNLQVVGRNLGILLLAAALVWIVRRGEKLPLTSIGLSTDRLGRSLVRGFLLAVISLIATVGLYLTLQHFGVQLGKSDGPFHPSMWVVTFAMLRAGIAEEIFYRGYAIERLQTITGNKWLAALVPLAAFAVAHYRQGLGGIIATFVLGAIFTIFYLRYRDLIGNITGHFLADFVLNVALPLVGG